MEILKLNSRLKTAEPAVALDPELPPGRYQLTLVVSSERGDSLPAEMLLMVTEPGVLRDPISPLERLSPVQPLSPLVAPKGRPRKPRATR